MGKFTIFEIWKKKVSMNFVAVIAIAVLTVALALVSYAYFLCRENLRRERKMNSVFYGLSRDLEGDTWRQKDTIQGQREGHDPGAAGGDREPGGGGPGEQGDGADAAAEAQGQRGTYRFHREAAAGYGRVGQCLPRELRAPRDVGPEGQGGAGLDHRGQGDVWAGGLADGGLLSRGMDMNRLSKWKTQLAKKMGSPVRLSKFLNEKLLNYSSRTAE